MRESTHTTWVILFTRINILVVLFDANVTAASQRGIDVLGLLVVPVRRHKLQQPLQHSAHRPLS